MKEKILGFLKKYNNDRSRLMDILLDIQAEYHHIPAEAVELIADQLDLSKVDVEQTISFYHFFSSKPVGKYAIYLNNSAVANMNGRAEVARAFEKELGISFNSVTGDGLVGLWDTADIGLNDQEPAAIINGAVFTKLDPSKVKTLISGIKAGKAVADLQPSMVEDNIRKEGPVLFSEYEVGKGLKNALAQTPEQVVEEVKNSNVRGPGWRWFPGRYEVGFLPQIRRGRGLPGLQC